MLKTAYYTRTSLPAKSREFFHAVKQFRTIHPFRFNTEKSALLIMDMQEYFLHKYSHAFIPAAGAIVPNIKKLADAFSANKQPVIVTKHANTPADAASMGNWWKKLMLKDDPLTAVSGEFSSPDYSIVEKSQYDAFYKTDLEDILQQHGIEDVVISGVMAHLCCETTARAAFMRGFNVYFMIDGTATYNEIFHAGTLYNLSHGCAVCALTAEILECFGG